MGVGSLPYLDSITLAHEDAMTTHDQRERKARRRTARHFAALREWVATLPPEERERLEARKRQGREALLGAPSRSGEPHPLPSRSGA